MNDDHAVQVRTQLENMLGSPFADGNRVTVLQNGDEIFPAMIDAIKGATKSIDFLTFVYWEGDIAQTFAEALASRASDGLRVRILLDSFGARLLHEDLLSLLERAGAEVRWFRPLSTWRLWRSDKRTHRKIMITDNARGFTGGVGIAEEWTGDAGGPDEWRDTHFAIEGPAVRSLNAAFMDNWNEAGEWTWDEVYEPPNQFEDGCTILGHRLALSPIFVFLAVVVWGWLWGAAGALMAVPIVTAIKVICDHVPRLQPVGNFMRGDNERGDVDSAPAALADPQETNVSWSAGD